MLALKEQVQNRPYDKGSADAPAANHSNRRPLLLVVVTLASVVYLVGLVHYAQVRPIDGDEGYYTSAARLVWEGKAPYRDFSYPQAPLLPYLYSWIWAVHPRSLVSMRFLSVTCGGLAVFLWGVCLLFVKRLPAKVALATFAVVLLNPYWVSWNVVVKTFAVANLLMSAAMICLYAALHVNRPRWYFIAGLALGACTSVRLLYAPLLPFVLAWLFLKEWRSAKFSFPQSLPFLAGATCGLLPIVSSFIGDPRAFIFNNVQYHPLLAGHVTFRHRIHSYLSITLSLLQAPYFIAEVLLAIVGCLIWLKLRKKEDSSITREDGRYFELAFLMLVVYLGTALIPVPSFDQYFDSPLVPFLVPFVAEGLRFAFGSQKQFALALAVLAPILFLREINRDARQCSSAPELQLLSYRRVTQTIEANSKSEEVVLSFWPGYIFESGRQYFPGFENKFNYQINRKMTSKARARYHIVSEDEIVNAVSHRSVNVFVTYPRIFDRIDDNLSPKELQEFRAALDANYSLLAEIDNIGVYQVRK